MSACVYDVTLCQSVSNIILQIQFLSQQIETTKVKCQIHLLDVRQSPRIITIKQKGFLCFHVSPSSFCLIL